MNTAMYENSAHQENLNKLRKMGYRIIEPSEGRLACGDIGKGKMAEPETIVSLIDSELTPFPDFRGKTVLITAGATEEPIDAVRYITNRSSGKMGVALAEAVQDRGGKVILIAGNISVKYPDVSSIIKVKTTVEMLEAVKIEMAKADIIIKAAAPSDYRIEEIFLQKIKAERLSLNLVKNPDIAKYVGKNKDRKILVVFAAETNDLLENASVKLKEKNADIIVANDVTKEGAGFGSDTNIATIIRKDGVMTSYERMPKRELADLILDNILEIS